MTPTPLGPIDLVYVVAYLMVVGIAGWAAVSAVLRPGRRHWAELAGLSVAAGMGLTALWFMLASTAGFRPTRGVLAAWAAVTAGMAGGTVVWRRGRVAAPTVPEPFRGKPDAAGAVGLLAAAALLAALANVWVVATAPGLGDIDEYATWMLKAKVVALAPLRPVPAALVDPTLSYSHQDYPLLLPLLAAGSYAAVGRMDESAAKVVLLPMYFALTALVYAAARRDHRRAVALAATALVAAAPVVVQKAPLLVGELPVTLYFAATVSLLARWARQGERPDLLLAGGFAAAAAFSKNEGLAMLPVFAVAAVAFAVTSGDRRRRLADWAAAVGVCLLLLSPWLIYRCWLPRTHEDYGGKFARLPSLAHGVTRLPHILGGMLANAVDVGVAGPVWIVLAIAVVVGRRAWRSAPVRVLWVVLAGQLGLYVAAFVVTPWDLDVLLPMVTSKLLGQAAPVAAVLVGLHLATPGPASPADSGLVRRP